MKELGGYFEFELPKKTEFHKDAVRLNSGRNALEYILLAKNYTKVYIPFYTCDAVLHSIEKLGIKYEFYKIDYKLNPIFNFEKIRTNEAFLYTNYFGVMYSKLIEICKIHENIILDNSQAFYTPKINENDCFYSPRKFFGVPDGSYLYCNKRLKAPLKIDKSSSRFSFLFDRIENNATIGYSSFIKNEIFLNEAPMLKMSKFTRRVLESIDYDKVAEIRVNNYKYLSKYLDLYNLNIFKLHSEDIPMFYPFFTEKYFLRELLIKDKIYVPNYWKNVYDWVGDDAVEFKLAKTLLPLPIDQRYTNKDLSRIIKIITNEYKK
jgi:hypothetical protein